MIVFVLTFFITFTFIFLLASLSSLWLAPSRFRVSVKSVINLSFSVFKFNSNSVLTLILRRVFLLFLLLNGVSNIPYSSSPALYYFFSASFSFTLWLPLVVVIVFTQFRDFLAHLIPYGAPMFLSILLPVVELFSQIIRPLTLIIRLRTNLSAGHIILYMFSFFSLSRFVLSFVTLNLCLMLLLLELAIAGLQAYIFTSLSYLYVTETVYVFFSS